MVIPTPPLTLGIEEEYQIIEPHSRNLYSYISEFLSQDKVRPHRLNLKPEFMQSQVEVGRLSGRSSIARSIASISNSSGNLRSTQALIVSSAIVNLL